MQMLELKRGDGSQEVISFWVMGPINYASLKLADYTSWNMKVNYEKHVLAELREFLYSQRIFGKDWVKSTDIYISMSSNQNHVRD